MTTILMIANVNDKIKWLNFFYTNNFFYLKAELLEEDIYMT